MLLGLGHSEIFPSTAIVEPWTKGASQELNPGPSEYKQSLGFTAQPKGHQRIETLASSQRQSPTGSDHSCMSRPARPAQHGTEAAALPKCWPSTPAPAMQRNPDSGNGGFIQPSWLMVTAALVLLHDPFQSAFKATYATGGHHILWHQSSTN